MRHENAENSDPFTLHISHATMFSQPNFNLFALNSVASIEITTRTGLRFLSTLFRKCGAQKLYEQPITVYVGYNGSGNNRFPVTTDYFCLFAWSPCIFNEAHFRLQQTRLQQTFGYDRLNLGENCSY